MLLQAGGEIRFETRPLEGLEDDIPNEQEPERLILDGQQRLTTLTQSLSLITPVRTRTSRGRGIKRYYYFDIYKAVNVPHALDEAIIAVDENRRLLSNFGRSIDLDLSTTELECQNLHFPCNQIMNSDRWESTLHRCASESWNIYLAFREQIMYPFREYQIPVILLKKETSKEAVCLVFEKVNTGGVQLSVFELITASYAADGYNLRDDWFGSTIRSVESRKDRLGQDALLEGIEATEFLQAITLLYTHELKKLDPGTDAVGRPLRPVSAKRADVLQLPLSAWDTWADRLEQGFRQVARFLRKECFYDRRELPYSTQLIPLAAVFTRLEDRWLEPKIYDKIARWFWCGVLGELYGGAVETRIANDYEELLNWIDNDDALPRTVRDSNFQLDRLDTLYTRVSAAYKAINVLVLREGSKDWFWKASILELDADEVALDIHHIFPRSWCENQGFGREKYDCILNKTPISYKANRKIGGEAPSVYLSKLQNEIQVSLTDSEMDELLASHALTPSLLRQDQFERFLEDRRQCLGRLIEKAMGKAIVGNWDDETVEGDETPPN